MSKKEPISIQLIRLLGMTPNSLPGVIRLPNSLHLATLELPDKDNQKEISCIPYGSYTCIRTVASPGITGGLCETFEVIRVPNRSDILFHIANLPSELRGCIALGRQFGKINDEAGVAYSTKAFKMFMDYLSEVDEFTLNVGKVGEYV